MTKRLKIGLWEIGCVLWVCVAGSMLHFAFELSDYWRPMALLAAVNESVWEHCKMYFWPGLFFALVQYTYTRDVANNYWLGKVVALFCTPVFIIASYYAYMSYALSTSGKASLPAMLSIMVFGIALAQFMSYKILSAKPLNLKSAAPVMASYSALLIMFGAFTYFPPKAIFFENFYCYQYTGEFGILSDYEPYRVFKRPGDEAAAGGVNYCANLTMADNGAT